MVVGSVIAYTDKLTEDQIQKVGLYYDGPIKIGGQIIIDYEGNISSSELTTIIGDIISTDQITQMTSTFGNDQNS